ncbi:NAD(P)H-hydrate dehydratase [Oleisolibacter albus]|uniref:NAD(P)H-hydrate dehydratase n=1 Tax=Oleisolibacter albus TaxID=2171757 RepID=UPI000DF26403|nr:NAD(P)H-hydrate dehydratase [Oleisolibacter albus]
MRAELLSIEQMYAADRAAMAAGIAGTALMERAGRAVAEAVAARWTARPVTVLCGPGNNGGDGFVAARHLRAMGWPVRLALLGARDGLAGDAAWAAAGWDGSVEMADPAVLTGAGLVIDALFGAGLTRPLEDMAQTLVEAVIAAGLPVVAVDVPSGVNGDDGSVMGIAPRAALTVTFFRRKPGHLLLPGRLHCGEIVLADIGIPDTVLPDLEIRCRENGPDLWLDRFPWPQADGHKYSRGHALLLGGGVMTGAGRLAARAALRAGAGLVTIAAPMAALPIYAVSIPSAIVMPADDPAAWTALLDDPRRNAVLLGPGAGADDRLKKAVREALCNEKAGVLDADVFTAFAGDLDSLRIGLNDHWLLTPHAGEFERLFGDLPGSKLERVRLAALESRAVVLLKGADTVIAHPDGRAVIAANGTPDLATAGSGDVLSGLALGLLAQGLDAFDAACIAAWLHGEAGRLAGPGLIAEDLPELLPPVLRRLKGGEERRGGRG